MSTGWRPEPHWACSCGVWHPPEQTACPDCKRSRPPDSTLTPPRSRDPYVRCGACGRVVPNDPLCPQCGARLRRRTGEEAQALRDAEVQQLAAELARPGPDRTLADTWGDLARLYWDSKDFTRALVCAQRAVAADPKHTPAWCYCLGSLNRLGRHTEAVATYRSIKGLPKGDKTNTVRGWVDG